MKLVWRGFLNQKRLAIGSWWNFSGSLFILMLGTNDSKQRFSLPASDIAAGIETLVKMIKQSDTGRDGQAPDILIMAPPPIVKAGPYTEMFAGGVEKSKRFGDLYRQVAETHGCHFFNTAEVIVSSDRDGIHFELSEHQKLGEALVPLVREIVA